MKSNVGGRRRHSVRGTKEAHSGRRCQGRTRVGEDARPKHGVIWNMAVWGIQSIHHGADSLALWSQKAGSGTDEEQRRRRKRHRETNRGSRGATSISESKQREKRTDIGN
jgi:hypothetical protein